MQNSNFKRLLAVVLTVLMTLTAIPFSASAADEATPKAVAFGTYSETTLVWDVLEKTDGGDYVLISKNVIAKEKFGGKDYAAAPIFAALNTTFFGSAFTAAEQAYLKDRTVNYTTNGAAATVTGKVTLPSVADQSAYSLGAADLLGTTTKTEYWLADQNAKTINIRTVSTAGKLLAKGNGTSQGYRAMIVLDGTKLVNLTAADNVTYTTVSGAEIDAVAAGTPFKVVLAEAYSESAITVKANGAAIEAVDGVYSVSASPVTVEGVVPNPADYSLYNLKVEMAAELNEDDYTAESWAALKEALAVDVSNLTVLDQDKVNNAYLAIAVAMDNLKAAPADFTNYDKAVADAEHILKNLQIFDATGTVPGTYQTYQYYLTQATKESAVAEIHAKVKAEQAQVDEATAYLQGLIDGVGYRPANIDLWVKAVNVRDTLNKEFFEPDYVDAVWAIIDEVVAERDFRVDRPTIIDQAMVDDATERMNAVIGKTDDHWLPADFTALEEAIAVADTYLAENYYKDEEVERDEEKGGTAAWDLFEKARDSAKALLETKANNPTKKAHQTMIDETTKSLVDATLGMDKYIRLGKWDRFVKDVNYFFSDTKATIEGIIALLKTVFGLLKMVFSGEISLYDALKDFGVDQEILDIVEKLGFKPTPPEEEVPAEPAA